MSSIKQQMLSGVFFNAVAKYSGLVISLVVAGILGRLISPDDFGVMTIAMVIISFFELLSNIGFSAAIIQHKDLTDHDLRSIFSFTLWMAILLALLFFSASGTIAAYYNNDSLRPICQMLSIYLFFNCASMVPNTLFYRDKKFKLLAIRTLSIQLLSGVAAVTAACQGLGLYALLLQSVLSGSCLFLLSIYHYPLRPLLTVGLDSIRKVWSYSLFQFLFNVINYFTRNMDKLLIGRFLGMGPLGYYDKSYRLMMLPVQNITQVITPVLHPILSDYQKQHQRLCEAHEKMVHILALVGFPLSMLVFFCADEAMLLVFGHQWLASIPAFRVLSLTIGIQLVLSSSGSFYQSGGNTKAMFHCALFAAAVNTVGLLAGIFLFRSLIAIAWCIVVSFVFSFLQCYLLLYRVVFHQSIRSFFSHLRSPLLLSVLVALVLWPVSHGCTYLQELSCWPVTGWLTFLPLLVSLVIKGGVALVVAAVYLQRSGEYDWVGWLRRRG